MADLTYISKGNAKTECFSFDLPAIDTCPGRTEECSNDCYALQLMLMYKAVNAKYLRNLAFTDDPNFVAYMTTAIPRGCQFRIHVSGDFKDAKYITKWFRIALARPDVMFYAYTRSWRIPKLWNAIQALHALGNVNVNLSVDDETGAPSVLNAEKYRWCYLTKTDSAPDWIRRTDIVFRSNHAGHKRRRRNAVKKGNTPPSLVKRLNGQVCPLEQGQEIPNFSCKKCMLCVDKPRPITINA